MGGGAANLDIGTVGFENPGHRVLAAPVVIVIIIIVVIPVTHPLVVVLTVSHVLPLLAAFGVLSLGVFAVVIIARCGTPKAHRIAVQFKSASNFAVCRVQQDAFPNCRQSAGRTKSFSLSKQAQVFSHESQAQYQAFVRFEVASSAALSAIALNQDLAFGTFHSGRALSF
jgi:hypothetical protein